MVSCGADKSIIFRDVNTEDSAGITLSRVNHIVGKTTLYDMELDRSAIKKSVALCYCGLQGVGSHGSKSFRLTRSFSYGAGS